MIAALILAWGALPYLPGQIDDAYIVFAYAHNIVNHGEIAWNTGVRVEGYSSPLHLALMVLGCFTGLDLSVFARVISFAAALTTLAIVIRPRFGPGGVALAVMLAAWQPFQHWSVAGLETSLATLLAACGWPLVFGTRGSWAAGCLVLTAFSLTRPEGGAWLAAGLFLRARSPWEFGRPERVVASGLVAFAAYHLARFSYFGDLFPTPWLVKIVAIDGFVGGAKEAGSEVVSAVPLLVATFMARRRIPIWVWAPLLIQVALLIRAGGDWMGNARFLVPGVVASVSAAFVAGTPRPLPRFTFLALIPLAALSFAWEPAQMQGMGPRWRDSWFLAQPWAALRTPWSVPLLDEVAFVINRVPVSAGVELSDVGLPGNLDDVRIWDGAGLTDRVVAKIIAGSEPGLSDALKARFDDPTAIWCLRYGVDEAGLDPGDDWIKDLFPEVATTPDARGLFWRCRAGGTPTASVANGRWGRLLSRFPWQDGIRWSYARALIAEGRTEDAITVAREATWVGADADGWVSFAPPGGSYFPGRGWPLYANGTLSTSAFPPRFWAGRIASFDADDPGDEGARVSLRWEPLCGAPVVIQVTTRTEAPLPACENEAPRKLVVEFLNDEKIGDIDRNLYVTLVPDSAATSAP